VPPLLPVEPGSSLPSRRKHHMPLHFSFDVSFFGQSEQDRAHHQNQPKPIEQPQPKPDKQGPDHSAIHALANYQQIKDFHKWRIQRIKELSLKKQMPSKEKFFHGLILIQM
jgi:hypothetical protein